MSQSATPDAGPIPQAHGPRQSIARFTEYRDAQRLVDRLSDERFPVDRVAIVGSDLRLVEAVTGRVTNATAAGAGAATGAWFGLFLGLLVGLFTFDPSWLGLIVGGLVIGAIWGAVFGFVGHLATGGRRDFSSKSTLAAGCYDVMVDVDHVEAAQRLVPAPA